MTASTQPITETSVDETASASLLSVQEGREHCLAVGQDGYPVVLTPSGVLTAIPDPDAGQRPFPLTWERVEKIVGAAVLDDLVTDSTEVVLDGLLGDSPYTLTFDQAVELLREVCAHRALSSWFFVITLTVDRETGQRDVAVATGDGDIPCETVGSDGAGTQVLTPQAARDLLGKVADLPSSTRFGYIADNSTYTHVMGTYVVAPATEVEIVPTSKNTLRGGYLVLTRKEMRSVVAAIAEALAAG